MGRRVEPLSNDGFARWWKETGESELRQILHWKWDPIGIAYTFPWAADEYDEYAARVAESLNGGASVNEIRDLLRLIEIDRMALTDSATATATRGEVADFIVEWYPNSLERWRQFGPRPG